MSTITDQWITLDEAATRFNLPQATLNRWAKIGIPALRGRKLPVRRVKGWKPGSDSPRLRVDATTLEEWDKLSVFIGDHTDLAGNKWASESLAGEQCGLQPDELKWWRKHPCHFLDGRKLKRILIGVVLLVNGQKKSAKRFVYLVEDLDRIARGLKDQQAGFVPEWGVRGLALGEVLERYPDLNKDRLRELRESGKVRAARVWVIETGKSDTPRRRRRWVYHPVNLQAIAEAPPAIADPNWIGLADVAQLGLKPPTVKSWHLKGAAHLDGKKPCSRMFEVEVTFKGKKNEQHRRRRKVRQFWIADLFPKGQHPAVVTPPAKEVQPVAAIDRALLIKARNPNLSLREVARRAGCSPSLLSGDDRFRRLAEASARPVPRGSKTKDGRLEAEDDG